MVEWIRPIIYFSIFSTILLQLLPTTNYKKYIRFFIGLLMILFVTEPLLDFFSGENMTEQIFNMMDSLYLENSIGSN